MTHLETNDARGFQEYGILKRLPLLFSNEREVAAVFLFCFDVVGCNGQHGGIHRGHGGRSDDAMQIKEEGRACACSFCGDVCSAACL